MNKQTTGVVTNWYSKESLLQACYSDVAGDLKKHEAVRKVSNTN